MKFKLMLLIIVTTSCVTLHNGVTADFVPVADARALDGKYLNWNGDPRSNVSLLSCFNIGAYADFASISLEDPHTLKLTYVTDSGRCEKDFKGEMKKKFFEIYFSKERKSIPLIFNSYDIDRIRIGKIKEGKILIKKYVSRGGNLLIIADGETSDDFYSFGRASDYKGLLPVSDGRHWGYTDSVGKYSIAPKYDFATVFADSAALVRLGGKWGVINTRGEEIVPCCYDRISLIDTVAKPHIFKVRTGTKFGVYDTRGHELIPPVYDAVDDYTDKISDQATVFPPRIFRVTANGKMGVLDDKGKVLLPIIYDKINYDYGRWPNSWIEARLGDKSGFLTTTLKVVPPIYSSYWSSDLHGHVFIRDRKEYVIDEDGYEYQVKGIFSKRDIKTKRKVLIDP